MAFFLLLKNFVMDLLGLHVHQRRSITQEASSEIQENKVWYT